MLYVSTKSTNYTISTLKITKGNNSAKNVGRVNVVNLCMSSGQALYLCQVS